MPEELNIDGAIEITSISDIPSQGTGLGSSSSYTVGLLQALYAHRNQHVGAERRAREACDVEIEHWSVDDFQEDTVRLNNSLPESRLSVYCLPERAETRKMCAPVHAPTRAFKLL